MKTKEEIEQKKKDLIHERQLFNEGSLGYIDITKEIKLLEWVLG